MDRTAHRRGGGKNLGDRSGLKHQIGAENAEHESQRSPTRFDYESLDRRRACAGLSEPETDQQIGGKANTFPTEETSGRGLSAVTSISIAKVNSDR